MASSWEAVLASSAVSSVISAAIVHGSKLWTERQQRKTVAHQLARSLEGYAMQCAHEIVDADEAARLADKHQDDTYYCSKELPELQIQSADLDRLEPDWRDRISAFPNQINAERRYLSTMVEELDDVYEWKVIKQTSRATLGRAAFALATEVREGHKLPTEHAAVACKSSLNIFTSAFESKERLDRHLEECNARLNAQFVGAQATTH